MKQKDRERYIRWQDYRITQLSFSINLFLTFGVAALGFWVKMLLDEKFILVPEGKVNFFWALFWLCISIIFGVLSTLSRLIDFRYTALKIRKRYIGWRKKSIEFTTKYIGEVTWICFGVQTGSLIMGVYFLLVSIIGKYLYKLI